jgi:hypothetical protein
MWLRQTQDGFVLVRLQFPARIVHAEIVTIFGAFKRGAGRASWTFSQAITHGSLL